MWKRLRRWGAIAGIGAVGLLIAIQAVPYGHGHSNPPDRQEPAWDGQQTRAMVVDACYDCHSNRTAWPWYSYLAPVSWLAQRDVDGGREKLNFSEWSRAGQETDEIVEKVQEGEMPPSYYGWLHSKARLSSAERQALLRGLEATFGGDGTRNGEGENGEEEEQE
jgi:mono/diheme cytochrome c family protein